jgi:release factor glutamine methyltransferase
MAGLDHLRRLIETAPGHLPAGGHLMLEIGWDQRPAVEALAETVAAYDRIGFRQDYGGHDRVAILRRR